MPASDLHVRLNGREAVFSAALVEVTFGRDLSCLVRLNLPEIAPRHLTVRYEDGVWIAEQAGEEHDVYLDGQRVTRVSVDELLPLRLGDPDNGPLVEVSPVGNDALSLETSDWGTDQGRVAEVGVRDAATRATGAEHAPTRARPARFRLSAGVVRLGRDPSSDLALDDLLASRRHAELRRRDDGGYDVLDLNSHNGTYVNGHRVDRVSLEQLDVIVIGHHSLRLIGEYLEEYIDTGEVAYAAVDLTVRLPTDEILLDRVSFSLEPRALLAIIGPSGSGKSTLINALTGFSMAGEGDVRYDDQSLYANYDALRRRIGFVPQDDVVHPELTVRDTLTYAADIRFPSDVEPAARRRRIDAVLDELGLAHRADLQVSKLSAGERKRVSLALELLTEPSLLFLDEPTSGLDPGFERNVMQILRKLADAGRTVVVVTHGTQSLRLCDRVLVLARGGRVAYFGPPQLVAAYFDRREYADVFTALNDHPETDWGERFRMHPYFSEYVRRDGGGEPPPVTSPVPAGRTSSAGGWWGQFVTLTRRYIAVLVADRRNLALVLLQAPLLGALMLVALPGGQLGPAPGSQFRLISQANLVLLVVILGVTYLGMSSAVREIAKEDALFRRERAAGLSIVAYIASKAAVLGLITAVQSALLVVLATADQGGPRYASVLGWGLGELIVVAALAGFAAVTLGLAISAIARTTDRATTILPVVLVFELVLALGGVVPQIGSRPVLKQLGYVSSTRWGFAAAASTSDLNNLGAVAGVLTRVPTVRLDDPSPLFRAFSKGERGEPTWDHTAGAWLLDAGVLVALSGVALLACALVLRHRDPGRRPG